MTKHTTLKLLATMLPTVAVTTIGVSTLWARGFDDTVQTYCWAVVNKVINDENSPANPENTYTEGDLVCYVDCIRDNQCEFDEENMAVDGGWLKVSNARPTHANDGCGCVSNDV